MTGYRRVVAISSYANFTDWDERVTPVQSGVARTDLVPDLLSGTPMRPPDPQSMGHAGSNPIEINKMVGPAGLEPATYRL